MACENGSLTAVHVYLSPQCLHSSHFVPLNLDFVLLTPNRYALLLKSQASGFLLAGFFPARCAYSFLEKIK